MEISPELYWSWHALATSLWAYAEQAEGRERLRRESPAVHAEKIANALAVAYHEASKESAWKLVEPQRFYAIQLYKCAPHLKERRRSVALYRLLRLQLSKI